MDKVIEMEKTNEKDGNSSNESYTRSGATLQRSGTMLNLLSIKKTAAQGMMDVALMTSNANQLRYLVEFSPRGVTFRCLFILIILSLVLQVIVGVILIMRGRSDFRRRATFPRGKTKYDIHLNQCTSVGVFLIVAVNVFIAAFSVSISKQDLPAQEAAQAQ